MEFLIDKATRPLIIAEVGVNHNGDLSLAKEMISSASKSGADFVKLQSFVMEEFFSPTLDYYTETETFSLGFNEQTELFEYASRENILLITTPFDIKSVDFIDQFNVPAYKIASMDCNNYPLIRHIASKKKYIFLSTGMADIEEIGNAINVCKEEGNEDIILLHCVSNYPTDYRDLNLNFMLKMHDLFGFSVGLSDHTLGVENAMVAASLGAKIIEKHFTTDPDMDKEYPGADHDIAITPSELKQLSVFCDKIPLIMGNSDRVFSENENNGRQKMRRSWYARKNIFPGEVFSMSNMVALRPVRGISVADEKKIIGKKATNSILKGLPIQFTDIS
ncbi:MAG: N-acetylneuraminate synthase family protein [Bacteroidales bacterium]|nr:N-acetylneuraminate synthase family protein [Bacteroidales bacterium]